DTATTEIYSLSLTTLFRSLDPPGHPVGVPRTPPARTAAVPAGPVIGSHRSPRPPAPGAYRRGAGAARGGPGARRAGRPAVGRAGWPGRGRVGRLAATLPPLRAGPYLAARRPRRATHRPPASPAFPGRVRGFPPTN